MDLPDQNTERKSVVLAKGEFLKQVPIIDD